MPIYPKIFVINLPRRKDRLSKVYSQFVNSGLNVEVWPAVDGKHLSIPEDSTKKYEYNAHGILGCMTSHYNLIKYAKENDLKSIFVLEDDIILSDNFIEYYKMIPGLDFDMLYFGGHFDVIDKDIIKTNIENIYKCNQVAGTYAYVIKNTVYDYVLKNCNYNWGIDQFYGDVVQKKFNCLIFIPTVVDHIDGFSDIAGREIKYPATHKYFK